MNIATGSVLNVAPAGHDWVIAFDYGDETAPEIVCPIIGWATVVDAHLTDGSATTSLQPVFLHLDMVWTPNELREHNHEVTSFEIRAREITRPVTKVEIVEPGEQDASPEVRVFHRETGWTVIPEHGVEGCTSNFFRQQDGRPVCTGTAVWKVVQECGTGVSIGFYCDADLPAEYSDARELRA